MNQTNSTTLAARIRALLSKTTENGCSEAEAMAAALKARELMDRYHIDQGAVEMEAEGTLKFDTKTPHKLHYTIRRQLLLRVAAFCDCRTFVFDRRRESTFFGLRSDVEFATWLADSLTTFILAQCLEFQLRSINDNADGNSFMQGAIDSINARLHEATKARAATGTGNALVVCKSAIVDRDFAKLGLSLGRGRAGYNLGGRNGESYQAGRAAGDSASFGRPISGARAALTHKPR